MSALTLNRIAQRSNQPHQEPLTLEGNPMPLLHLNARSRYILSEEILEVFAEEISR